MVTAKQTVVRMTPVKETRRTFRFDAVSEDAAIKNVYVDKAEFPNGMPTEIDVIVRIP
jgi:hypothetical protein